MIESDITCLFPAANKHLIFISQSTQQLRSKRFFYSTYNNEIWAACKSRKSPVSFNRIATVALNQSNCSQTVETERVHSICSWSAQRGSETKYFGRIVNDKDYEVITGKIKMATIIPVQLRM